jgi:hypothetical protein
MTRNMSDDLRYQKKAITTLPVEYDGNSLSINFRLRLDTHEFGLGYKKKSKNDLI